MGKQEEKDELENGKTTSEAQAEQETHEAAKNVRKKGPRQAAKTDDEDEEEVTPATRKQAQEELFAAVQRLKEEGKKKSARDKG